MGEIRNINTLVLDAMRGKLGRKKFLCFKSRPTPMLRVHDLGIPFRASAPV